MQVTCSASRAQTNPSPVYSLKKVATGNIPLQFRGHIPEWFQQQLGTNIKIDNIHFSFSKAIIDSRFGVAVSIIQNEIYGYSKAMADLFCKTLDDRAYVSDLFCALTEEGVITEDQSNRLFVLLMAMDGLDIEVNECGARAEERHFAYLQEFIQIINSIVQTHQFTIGVSDAIAGEYIYSPYSNDSYTEMPAKEKSVDIDELFDCIYAWTSSNSFDPIASATATIS